MKTSVIRHRVADFFRRYPPFDSLSEDDLLSLTQSGRVHFFESESYVFEQGRDRSNVLWVIQQGAIELWDESASTAKQIDLLGAGEILGIDRYFGEATHSHSARTASDVILYSIDAGRFAELIDRIPEVADYVSAHAVVGMQAQSGSWLQAAAPPASCLAHSSPASREVPGGRSAGFYFLEMLERNTTSLRVSDRELPDGKLALFAGENPIALARELRESTEPAQWGPLLRLADRMAVAGLDSRHAAQLSAPIATHHNTAFLRSAIREAERSLDNVTQAVPHSWIVFGRAAREEILLQRRPRLAVLYAGDVSLPPLDNCLLAVQRFCDESGLPSPPDDSEVSPSQPADHWIADITRRICEPIEHSIYEARMFLDMRGVAGDGSIVERLRDSIATALRASPVCLAILAHDTLSRLPPLTFFGDLVVDLDGARRESVDLFAAGVLPIVDAARVLALSTGELTLIRTKDRLEAAGRKYAQAESILRTAASAFDVALYFQARARLRNPGRTAVVRPGDLSRYDQRILKTAFQSIQRLLEWTSEEFVSRGLR